MSVGPTGAMRGLQAGAVLSDFSINQTFDKDQFGKIGIC